MTSGIVKALLLYVLLHQEALICICPSGAVVRPVINVTPVLLPFFKQMFVLGGANLCFLKNNMFENHKIAPEVFYLPC